MKFHVGDVVRTLSNKDSFGHELFPVGSVGVIVEIREYVVQKYKVVVGDEEWGYEEDMLELVRGGTYEDGLNDAWECAKKIHDHKIPFEAFGLSHGNSWASPLNWSETMTASEAVIKVAEYEAKKKDEERIKVGDEVFRYSLWVVVSIDNSDYAVGFDSNGLLHRDAIANLVKTGRHFRQIKEVLNKMKEGHDADSN